MSNKGPWFAWDSDDSDRDGGRSYTRKDAFDAQDAARLHAEYEYRNSAGEIGTGFEVHVAEVSENGIEVVFKFEITVEFEPTFSATKLD